MADVQGTATTAEANRPHRRWLSIVANLAWLTAAACLLTPIELKDKYPLVAGLEALAFVVFFVACVVGFFSAWSERRSMNRESVSKESSERSG